MQVMTWHQLIILFRQLFFFCPCTFNNIFSSFILSSSIFCEVYISCVLRKHIERERESKCSARMQQRCPTDSHGEWLSCIFVVLRRCSGFEDFFCAVPVNGVQLCRADMVCFEPLMSAVTCRYGDHPAAPVKYFDIKLRVTHACDLSLRSQLHGYAYCLPFVS